MSRDEIEDGMGFAGLAPTATERREERERARIITENKWLRGENAKAAAEIERLRALIVLGDFTNLRPNSDSFKLVQQIRREQSTGEQTAPEQEKRVTRTHFDTDGCDPPKWYGPTGE